MASWHLSWQFLIVVTHNCRVLIQELADYEKMPDGPKISADTLEKDGFGRETFFRCIVAELNMKVGHISYGFNGLN